MSIKVGDYIVLKNDIPNTERELQNSKFPLKVESIEKCNSRGDDACTECPGYVNSKICFGRSMPGYNGYIVKHLSRDWDE